MKIPKYFAQMNELNKKLDLNELSMGMSSDYLNAIENGSTLYKNRIKYIWSKKLKNFYFSIFIY